jgi:hypothetical protein
LFRLWLVLSVLWIGGVGVVTWDSLPPAYENPKSWGAVPVEKENTTEFNPDKFLASASAEERRSAIWHASLLAVVPPSFVLALGSALVWAFRGFR